MGEPYKKKGRGSAKGYMEVIDITEDSPEVLERAKELFERRIKAFHESHE